MEDTRQDFHAVQKKLKIQHGDNDTLKEMLDNDDELATKVLKLLADEKDKDKKEEEKIFTFTLQNYIEIHDGCDPYWDYGDEHSGMYESLRKKYPELELPEPTEDDENPPPKIDETGDIYFELDAHAYPTPKEPRVVYLPVETKFGKPYF